MGEGLCFYSERQYLLWRGGAQTTDSGSQGERACHCLASLCSINACHTWKDNSATWLTFQQGNDQLLLSNPEGKRLFLSSDSSSWKLLFLSACFLHLFLENTEELEVDFLVLVYLCWNPVFLKGLWEVSVWSVRLWGGREKKVKKTKEKSCCCLSVWWRATVCVAMLVCLQGSSLESAGLVNPTRTVRLASVWLPHSQLFLPLFLFTPAVNPIWWGCLAPLQSVEECLQHSCHGRGTGGPVGQ